MMTSLPRKFLPLKEPQPPDANMFQSPDAVDAETPLKPSELKVLRDQYEKEGDMAGVQTKFNYAWVCLVSSFCPYT